MGKTTKVKIARNDAVKQSQAPHYSRTWFSQMVQQGLSGEFSGFFDITPTIARQMLEYNTSNRNVVRANLKRCIKAFKEGRFAVNGEAIIVAKDGSLNDGQHRLMACVETGVTFRTNVAFGLERDTRFTIDTGSVRSNATMLGIYGISNATAVAAAVGQYLLYDAGVYHFATSGLVTAEDEIDFIRKNTKLVERAMELTKTKIARTMGHSSIAAAFMILYPINPVEADGFFQKLIEGTGLVRGDPILALRNKLSIETVSAMRNHIRIELILRAWNAHRRGDQRSQMRTLGAYPEDIEV